MEWRIESWDCHEGSSPRSLNWPPCGGWNKGYPSGKRRARWRSTPTCCIAGAGSSAKARATSFRAMASSAGRKAGSQSWSARSASKRWRHGSDRRRLRTIQVDENVAGVMVVGVGLHIDVAAFAVARAQEAHRGGTSQLLGCPKPFARERLPGPVMNQADQEQLIGHGGKLSANGPQGEKETAVFHDRNFAVETNRRTMNFQRTANCVLTVCLSPGGRFKECARNYRLSA